MSVSREGSLYIVLLSLHGLIRGRDLELGRNADTGGQTKYVVELALALAESPAVERVDLLTRLVPAPDLSPDYSVPEEQIAEKARIIRVPFGPPRYLRKEVLWPWLPHFTDNTLQHFKRVGRTPDIIHAHYADAGSVGADLAALLGVPLVYTGHSLGREKLRLLLESGMERRRIDARYRMPQRIDAEEKALSHAAVVLASTQQEAAEQYAQYANYRKGRTVVIPPGVDLARFHPPKRREAKPPIYHRVSRFLADPTKPWILALSRPDERKNIHTLLDAYGNSAQLQQAANLVLIAGSRDDIETMDRGSRAVIQKILLQVDRYDLYGRVAYPKRHEADEVPSLYRLAAQSGGVFINPALTEPFGLTLIEAAASGLPIVATDDGGPRDIIAHCRNGVLINPQDAEGIAQTLLDVLSDRPRLRRWAASGVRSVASHYTWAGHVQSYLRAVRRVLNHHQGRRARAAKSSLPVADRLLVTDIDNTLLGDADGLKAFIERLGDGGNNFAFGVATGRRLESAVKELKSWDVPMPDFLVTAVGSEIHYGSQMTADEDWTRNIHYRWEPNAVREALASTPGLKLQPKSEQRQHKVSFFMDPAKAPALRDIAEQLRGIGVLAKVVFSHGQFLDLLPIRASKGLALRYLAHRWGIPMERVLVAGDSGNDRDMLTGRTLGVVVANYSEELNKLKAQKRVYFASQAHAWGIIEGIDHYDFFGKINQPD